MQNLALISLFTPLISALILGIFAFKPKNFFLGYLAFILVLVSAVSSIYLLINNAHFDFALGTWISLVDVKFGFKIDTITLTMMCVVGVVSACVHLYSIFYMEKDEGFNRYFSYLGFFVFSMMFLVMSDNFLGLFIGWEGVGVCSWLLIGFWFHNEKYTFAANEAFIMNRIADLALLLGIFLIYLEFGTLKYDDVFNLITSNYENNKILTLIAILLFIGAMGKSAQFPFHTWLADAMAGPTPVSALIHAATMVTAGVYLVIRAGELYLQVSEVGYFIALLGAFVALFAASMAMVAKDLKRIIAYSTLSQLGYMFVAAGLGAYAIALFHLVTHAFFKSLLFLGAGNVMHAMNDKLDISKMGGLYKSMRFSAILMLIGSLALAGIYPFAGFFSKDLILGFSFISHHHGIFLVLLISAFMTAFYSFRLLMLVFFTPQRHEEHPHEASKIALLAMSPLALLAVVAGLFEHKFMDFISSDLALIQAQNFLVMQLAIAAAIFGVLLAIIAYWKDWFKPSLAKTSIYKILFNEYYIPRFYHRFLVQKYTLFCEFLRKNDKEVLDAIVNGVAQFLQVFAKDIAIKGDFSLILRISILAFICLFCLVLVV
ncbi:NADH-quinone oxidoreductase subunit L [Campylobacter insulaenigrae]|uniref:NADH-quinone oxidoreductase subunit L n=9 Tax=Campylobacter insulaenigrae TaxID=260714 RepID=A0ABY3G6L3_9BACT|nr:NADH-quinone oxidoreductase subunit L [Campylobacter insulaenigrae]MCR6572576.1 NADH-quinone oxidoreductase subunit L [Campylobacter insulaenigrae]MCR6573938.1 NADH-quinone oxidoreductase subunit L [Campylobacter insulaenigrae]MCR6575668.1 NADH-quinone oxidoreductase subunit L [Campylobacter insulaenigrae]MCR6576950.1 NADH-quinone oxidoreductase subunit L [Campylobacter insulaenigrae]MCR6578764.1 NADH-quinone oxidoreductase subunit L [Campylobacter insulaenigrae]